MNDACEERDLGDLDGARITIVIHQDGRRDMYLRTLDDDEPVARLTFDEGQARLVAEALGGGSGVESRVTKSA
jgi:K+/H+ antiporter YhaU regulatory subunit KhtT